MQVAPVLSGPPRGTGVGGRYHDGGGVTDPAHGAGDVVFPMPDVCIFVLGTNDDRGPCACLHPVVLRAVGQTQSVGAASWSSEMRPGDRSWSAKHRVVI